MERGLRRWTIRNGRKIATAIAVSVAVIAPAVAFAWVHPGAAQVGKLPETSTAAPAAPTSEAQPEAPESVDVTTTVAPPKPGITAEQIRSAQQRLSDLGYWVGPVDGKLGGSTQQALYAFQKVQGLKRSGTLDTATQAALPHASRPRPASSGIDLIEIDKTRQVIFVVRGGAVQWVFNTSTGTEKNYVTNGIKGFAHTPTGTFKVNRVVDKVDPGDLGPLYRPRYFTNNGIAVHGAGSVPAYPASHGCARVSNAAMDFIWANNLMPMQSLVWVYEDPAKQPLSAQTTTTSSTTTTSTTVATTTSTSTSVAPSTSSTTPAATSSTSAVSPKLTSSTTSSTSTTTTVVH